MDLEGFPTCSTHGAMWFISGGLLHLLHDAARGHCDVFVGAKNVEDIPSSPTADCPSWEALIALYKLLGEDGDLDLQVLIEYFEDS